MNILATMAEMALQRDLAADDLVANLCERIPVITLTMPAPRHRYGCHEQATMNLLVQEELTL